jgi:hypothetical protein
MISKKVIVLNGAPGAGKDTFRDLLANYVDFRKVDYKDILFNELLNGVGSVKTQWWLNNYKPGFKDEPQDELNGLSMREVLIGFSENYIKPMKGVNFFAEEMVYKIKQCPSRIFVIADIGFQYELDELINEEGFDVYVLRIDKDGCSFDNDSRGSLEYDKIGYLNNNGTIDDLESQAKFVKDYLKL